MRNKIGHIILLLAWGLLLLAPHFSSSDFFPINTPGSSPYPVSIEEPQGGRLFDPRLNHNWEQNIIKVFQIRIFSPNYSRGNQLWEPIKKYLNHNDQLNFNFPRICYKFSLNKHTEEG